MSGVPSRRSAPGPRSKACRIVERGQAGGVDSLVGAPSAPLGVGMFDPVGTEEKFDFDAATGDAFDTFQSILKIKMITVQVNGNEMAWVCENHFGTEPNVQMAYSIETFAWDDDSETSSSRLTIQCPRRSATTATPTRTFLRVSSRSALEG